MLYIGAAAVAVAAAGALLYLSQKKKWALDWTELSLFLVEVANAAYPLQDIQHWKREPEDTTTITETEGECEIWKINMKHRYA